MCVCVCVWGGGGGGGGDMREVACGVGKGNPKAHTVQVFVLFFGVQVMYEFFQQVSLHNTKLFGVTKSRSRWI